VGSALPEELGCLGQCAMEPPLRKDGLVVCPALCEFASSGPSGRHEDHIVCGRSRSNGKGNERAEGKDCAAGHTSLRVRVVASRESSPERATDLDENGQRPEPTPGYDRVKRAHTASICFN
jgi:hypothetical protein